jgi:ParB family chromosome partitioning protein
MAENSVQKGQNPIRRNALGKGLSALMSVTAVSTKARPYLPQDLGTEHQSTELPSAELPEGEPTSATDLHYVELSRLTPNPSQPRREFSELELRELAESVRESGLIQPIIARKVGDSLQIVAGERRFRASKLAGLSTVPVILRELSDRDTLALGIVENVQRQDLNPIEEALAYQRLIEEFGETQNSVAKIVGKDRVSVTNTLRLLKLPAEVRELISQGKLSPGHGRALLSLGSEEQMLALAKESISKGYSVRTLEALCKGDGAGSSDIKITVTKTDQVLSRQELELSERIRRALGTKVQVKLSAPDKGEVRISFFSREELEGLLDRVERQNGPLFS